MPESMPMSLQWGPLHLIDSVRGRGEGIVEFLWLAGRSRGTVTCEALIPVIKTLGGHHSSSMVTCLKVVRIYAKTEGK